MSPNPHPDLDALPDEVFRARLRGFLEEHCPPAWRRPLTLRLRGEDERRWIRILLEHGWRCPSWPREWGGMGLSLHKQILYREEMERFGVARILDSGVLLLSPILFAYATEEQKRAYLPGILTGETIWAQGYSEPGSGSDLASLRTAAVRDGDDFVVNGQKIWTSHASDATHLFMLVRTAKTAKPQAGISFLLTPMEVPGITTRNIANLAAPDEFCEVFFDNVRIPAANLIGELNQGWTVAKALLGVERISTGSPTPSRLAVSVLRRLQAAGWGEEADPLLDARLARLAADVHDVTALYEDVREGTVAGVPVDMDAAALKLAATELFQRATEALTDSVGELGACEDELELGQVKAEIYRLSILARPGTIYGGSSEVQRNIIARSLIDKGGV